MKHDIRGIIFDMDETLLDTTAVWREAGIRFFKYFGAEYDPAVNARYKGLNGPDLGRAFHGHIDTRGMSADACADLFRTFLIECYGEPVRPMPGADAFLKRVSGTFPLAVASGSPLEGIKKVCGSHGWNGLFKVMLSSEQVAAGKPAPDVFSEAARRLDIPPEQCLVLEDSLIGVRAAKAAGMVCFAVPSSDDPEIGKLADRAFGKLNDISCEHIEGAKTCLT